jgi:putative protease
MSDDEVHAAIEIAHGGGAKLRVAINTNMQSHEIAPMLAKMDRFVSWGVDGAIMTDVGAIAEVHRRFPDLTIHASIGANILNNEDVRFYRSIGVSQVVADTKLTL